MKTNHVMNMNNLNYRLMQEWEVPEWIKIKPEDPNKIVEEFGMGKRQRKQVNYNDEISEGQWLKIIENGGDINQEVERIRKKKLDLKDKSGNQAEVMSNGVKRRKMNDNSASIISGDDYDREEDQDQSENYPQEYSNEAQSKVKIMGGKTQGLTIQIQNNAGPNIIRNEEDESSGM